MSKNKNNFTNDKLQWPDWEPILFTKRISYVSGHWLCLCCIGIATDSAECLLACWAALVGGGGRKWGWTNLMPGCLPAPTPRQMANELVNGMEITQDIFIHFTINPHVAISSIMFHTAPDTVRHSEGKQNDKELNTLSNHLLALCTTILQNIDLQMSRRLHIFSMQQRKFNWSSV